MKLTFNSLRKLKLLNAFPWTESEVNVMLKIIFVFLLSSENYFQYCDDELVLDCCKPIIC